MLDRIAGLTSGFETFVDFAKTEADDGCQQLVLRGEVLVEALHTDPSFRGDLLHGCLVVGKTTEDSLCCQQNVLASMLALRVAPSFGVLSPFGHY